MSGSEHRGIASTTEAKLRGVTRLRGLSRPKSAVQRNTGLASNTIVGAECDTELGARDEDTLYRAERLNPQQRDIFDYVLANLSACIVIQAGPGTGKTFTLRTIARTLDIKPVVVIYKKDLLEPFGNDAVTYTVAKFFMDTLGIEFFQWQGLERQICSRMSGIEYIAALVGMLSQSSCKLPKYTQVVVFDEYTVIPTSLLVVAIMYLRHHRIGVILCGDRDQLQTIYNSHNTNVSSYDIGRRFADKIFTLTVNERCPDPEYNRIIEFFSGFSSDRRLGRWSFCAVAVLFPHKLLSRALFQDVHLAATHHELTRMLHRVVTSEQVTCVFYYLDPSRARNPEAVQGALMSDGTIEPKLVTQYRLARDDREREAGKFLPYLPLKLGSLYYVDAHREANIGRLISVSADEVRLRLGTEEVVRRIGPCDDVIFPQHLDALRESSAGSVINFPLYPYNIMSVYKAQGCTILGHVSITLSASMTYQGLYVALSRVKSPTQLRHIAVGGLVPLLVSAIVNVPKFHAVEGVPRNATLKAAATPNHASDVQPVVPRRESLIADVAPILLRNYVYYAVRDEDSYVKDLGLFLGATTRNECERYRQAIIERARLEPEQHIVPAPPPSRYGDGGQSYENMNLRALELFLQHSDVFGALASLHQVHDRCVWLHEFMSLDLRLRSLPDNPTFGMGSLTCPSDERRPSTIDEIICARAWGTNESQRASEVTAVSSTLLMLAALDQAYALSCSTLRYIEKWAILEGRATVAELGVVRESPILENSEFCLFAETPFQQRVYAKIVSQTQGAARSIDKAWLFEQLHVMLEDAAAAATAEAASASSHVEDPKRRRTPSPPSAKRAKLVTKNKINS